MNKYNHSVIDEMVRDAEYLKILAAIALITVIAVGALLLNGIFQESIMKPLNKLSAITATTNFEVSDLDAQINDLVNGAK